MTSVEEPVDETADHTRLPAAEGLFGYMLLTDADRSALRLERAHALEADLCRIELILEEPLSGGERDQLMGRAAAIGQRLRVHLAALAGALPDPPNSLAPGVRHGIGDAP